MSVLTNVETARLEEIREFAVAKLAEHDLSDWSFGFDRAVRRFGVCYLGRKRITMSTRLSIAAYEAEWKDVVLHEIAHALAPADANHDARWRDIAISIGCTGERCHQLPVRLITPPPFIGSCPRGHEVEGYRRTKSSCAQCSNMFDERYLFVWERVA